MSISSAVVSFFSYFQNISVNIKLPHINFPPWFLTILKGVNDFISIIQYYILQIPPFDMRTRLILMSVIIPLFLDIFFIWFVQPLFKTLLNVLDTLCVFAFFGLCAYGNIVHWSRAVIILVCAFGLYLIIRLIFVFKKREQKYKLSQLGQDICHHYMHGLIPGIKDDYSIDDLNNIIHRFSKIVEIRPSPHVLYITVIFFSISAVTFLISFYFFGIYPFLRPPFSKQLNLLLAVIFILIGLTFFIIFTLRLFQCGRKFILRVKQFCKRWGLRILMLFFDVLYIPIVSGLIDHINVEKYSPCPEGQYLYEVPDRYGGTFSLLIEHETKCLTCNFMSNSSFYSRCVDACKGEPKWRPVCDPTLEFMRDIVKYSSGFLLWGFVFVVFGIPLLWFYVIQRNRKFAFIINVYGNEPSIKWLKIVNRMKTTGIFLFVNYKYNNSRWSVLYLMVKFLVMILATIASRFYKYLSLSLSVIYFVIFICVVIIKPYLYFVNNLLDSVLYFTQFLFSLNSSLAIFNVHVPLLVSSILSSIIVVVPFIAIIFLLFFRRRNADFENDPTYPQKLSKNEEEFLNQKRRAAKEEYRKNRKEEERENKIEEENENDAFVIDDDDGELNQNVGIDDINQPLLDKNENNDEDIDNKNYKKVVENVVKLVLLDDDENLCLIPEDEYEVRPGELDSVSQSIEKLKKKKNKVEPEDAATYIVNKRVLANRMTSMYEMLDVVVDGSTIDLLTKVLNVAIVCGMAAFGWYIGIVYSNDDINYHLICH